MRIKELSMLERRQLFGLFAPCVPHTTPHTMHYKARERIDAVLAGKIDTLDLSNLGLVELPDEVYSLTNLRELTVSNVLLMSSQSFIDLLSERPNLSESDIEFLKITEEAEQELQADLLVPKQLQFISPDIGRLKVLEVLDLQFNALERLPDAIGDLPKLRRLQLYQNKLRTLPDSLAHLPSLELLDVQENPLLSVPVLPQFEKYKDYRMHFWQQVRNAFREKDAKLGFWLYKKQTEYGLLS